MLSAVAISAADLALRNLLSECLQCEPAHGYPHDRRTLRADVVELQHADVLLAAIDTRKLFKCLVDESEVSSDLRRASLEPGAPVAVAPNPRAAIGSASAVAVRTHDLAFGYLPREPFDTRAEMTHLTHRPGFGAHVVELEHHEFVKTAVTTRMRR